MNTRPTTRRKRRASVQFPAIRWPKWVDDYEEWHPLNFTAYDVYKEEAFARVARRYKMGRQLLAPAYENMRIFEDATKAQQTRVTAGERAVDQFIEAKCFVHERKSARLRRERYGKFPVLKAEAIWPAKPLCPVCGKHKVMEPHSMAILRGGAMRVTDAKKHCAEIAEDCIGFLDVTWHGGLSGGPGVDSEIDAYVQLAEDTPRGQFEFYFCSTHCLRDFLNACVDQLELKMKKHAKIGRKATPRRTNRSKPKKMKQPAGANRRKSASSAREKMVTVTKRGKGL